MNDMSEPNRRTGLAAAAGAGASGPASSAVHGAAETLVVRQEGAVLFAEIAAPPMNLLGPELVRDLVSLIRHAEADDAVRVLVFTSADRDYFISRVDVTRIKEYREEAAKLVGEASLALLYRRLSTSRLVTIAQIEGRVRAAGSEFVLACDIRFAAAETAIFSQPEPALSSDPRRGRRPHLARSWAARGARVMLSAEDYDGAGRTVRLDQSSVARQHARRFRQIARASDRRVSGRRAGRGQGARQCDRARAGRGFSSGFRSVRRGRPQTRGAKPDPGRDEARLSDPRRGIGPGPDAGRVGRPLIQRD